jgi:hypothetical protein
LLPSGKYVSWIKLQFVAISAQPSRAKCSIVGRVDDSMADEKKEKPTIYSTPASRGNLTAVSTVKRRRRDAPEVRQQNGPRSFPLLGSQSELEKARQALIDDIHAPSHRHVVKAKMTTITKALQMWQMEPFPPPPRLTK